METTNLSQSLSNLWSWLETWLDEKGGVHGYIVHHHRDNLRILSPDTWTQAPCILGLLRIYQKTGNGKWLEMSTRLCDYLVGSYINSLHAYRNSNHEMKPLGRYALIDNVISSYALLEGAKEKKKIGADWEKYYIVARDNILHLLSSYWDDQVGAFISPAHVVPQHIHNMNSMTIMSLITLAEFEDDKSYIEKYAARIGRYILACQVKNGRLKGAYPYRDVTMNYITLYSLITCMGLFHLYKKTNNHDILLSVQDAINHLVSFIDKETGLICHYHRRGHPQWIPDTILLILILNRLRGEGQSTIDDSLLLSKVLSRQHLSGGFPLSIGFEDLWYRKGLPSRPELKRWRDELATPNWNAWNFWALSELLPESTEIKDPTIKLPLTFETDAEEREGPYRIAEYSDKVIIVSKDDQPLGIFYKRSEVADLCLIKERNEYWRIKGSLEKYPKFIYNLILDIPNLI